MTIFQLHSSSRLHKYIQCFHFIFVFSFSYFLAGVGSPSRHNLTFIKSRNSVCHPFFNRSNLQNNIAIITLETSVKISDKIKPIAVPSYNTRVPFPFEEGIITGFGLIDAAASIFSSQLLRAFHRVLTNSECTIRFPHMVGQMAHNFCARDHHAVTNICGGDQGSAFAVLERGVWTAVIDKNVTCLFSN